MSNAALAKANAQIDRLKDSLTEVKKDASAKLSGWRKAFSAKLEAADHRATRIGTAIGVGGVTGWIRGRYPDKADPAGIPIEAIAVVGGASAVVFGDEKDERTMNIAEGAVSGGGAAIAYKMAAEKGAKAKVEADKNKKP